MAKDMVRDEWQAVARGWRRWEPMLQSFTWPMSLRMVAAAARLRGALVPGGRIALSAWAPPEANPWITIPMAALAKVRTLPPTDPAVPGAFHLSQDGALAKALVGAGYQAVGQERVVLSWFAHDPDEFWAVTGDTAGPLASLLAELSAAERAQVKREVTEG